MKKTLLLLLFVSFFFTTGWSQNIGIGTSNPQQKLHVAGNIRVDAIAGPGGVLQYNSSGDLVPLANSGNPNDALLGNGSWGQVAGTIPAGTLVGTETYNDVALINRGFSLFGTIPGFYRYSNSTYTAPAGSWATTYYRGNVSKFSPPEFEPERLIAWADTVAYVFSGYSLYAYNPVADAWRYVQAIPVGFTYSPGAQMVWTGTELVVFGGVYTNGTNNGFRYNPGTNVWTAIPTTNQPSARVEFAMHFINGRVVVWGGYDRITSFIQASGAVLNLTTNTWTAISATNAPSGGKGFSSVATSTTMIIWGGVGVTALNTGSIFNPATNTWTVMTTTNAPAGRRLHIAVWSGTEMIVHGGTDLNGTVIYNTGGKYNPSTNTWTAIAAAPVARISHSAIWTGSRMLVTCGLSGSIALNPAEQDSYLYDPAGNTWSSGGTTGVRLNSHLSLLAGNMVLIMGGYPSVYNPVTGQYTQSLSWTQGSRYFLTSTATSRTLYQSVSNLYLYRKL